jgi:mono/diheme cytochrome c family protein
LRSSVLTALLFLIASFGILAALPGHAQNPASRQSAPPSAFVQGMRMLPSAGFQSATNQDAGQAQPPDGQAAAPVPAPTAPKPVELPDGDGKPIATEYCQECHRLTNLTKAHKNEDDWKDTVQTMIDRGARIPDDKVDTLVKYLTKNFGPKPATADSNGGGAAAAPATGSGASPVAGSSSDSPATAAPAAKVELPDGDGKEIATENCQACHKLTNLTKAHKSLDDWKDTVQTMIDRGANVPEDKVDTLVKYLAKNFGPKDDSAPASVAPSSATPAQ